MTVNIDGQLHNADWPKRSLDFADKVSTPAELDKELKGLGITPSAFRKLPLYQSTKDTALIKAWDKLHQ